MNDLLANIYENFRNFTGQSMIYSSQVMRSQRANKAWDYIYISASFRVIGRIANISYGANETSGMPLGSGSTLDDAITLGLTYVKHEPLHIGLKFSEVIRLDRVGKLTIIHGTELSYDPDDDMMWGAYYCG